MPVHLVNIGPYYDLSLRRAVLISDIWWLRNVSEVKYVAHMRKIG